MLDPPYRILICKTVLHRGAQALQRHRLHLHRRLLRHHHRQRAAELETRVRSQILQKEEGEAEGEALHRRQGEQRAGKGKLQVILFSNEYTDSQTLAGKVTETTCCPDLGSNTDSQPKP